MQKLAQNQPPCAEFGVLRRIEENLPNGAENAKTWLIFVNPFKFAKMARRICKSRTQNLNFLAQNSDVPRQNKPHIGLIPIAPTTLFSK